MHARWCHTRIQITSDETIKFRATYRLSRSKHLPISQGFRSTSWARETMGDFKWICGRREKGRKFPGPPLPLDHHYHHHHGGCCSSFGRRAKGLNVWENNPIVISPREHLLRDQHPQVSAVNRWQHELGGGRAEAGSPLCYAVVEETLHRTIGDVHSNRK